MNLVVNHCWTEGNKHRAEDDRGDFYHPAHD